MILTKRQCHEAQAALEVSLGNPEIQKQLDELEKNAKGNDNRYRFMLSKMLADKVYPAVVSRFDLPATAKGVQALTASIANRADLPMLQTWLTLETLMRNKA